MLDPKLLRNQLDEVATKLARRDLLLILSAIVT